jgi:hypothetical protein
MSKINEVDIEPLGMASGPEATSPVHQPLVSAADHSPRHPTSVVSDSDPESQSLDTVAGSEFIDDRIRLGE